MRSIDTNDRLFLQNVHNYMMNANLRTLKDDPEDGWQLVITYKRHHPSLKRNSRLISGGTPKPSLKRGV